MADCLTDIWRPWFAAAFDRASLAERVSWEMAFALERFQTPQGMGIKPGIMIYAQMPAATLGEVHMIMGQLPALGLTEEVVEREIRVIVDKLFEMRTAALTATNGLRAPDGPAMPWPRPEGGR